MNLLIPMNEISYFVLLGLGLCVGIMSGFFGVGGGWLITPALNILGIPMPYAIGTSLVYILITSSIATIKHRKLQNVSFTIGLMTGLSAIVGIIFGEKLILYLERIGNVDPVVRIIYIVFLLFTGTYIILENKWNFKSFQKKIKNPIPPVININIGKNKNQPISFFALVIIGCLIGFLQSVMGVGGGFLLFPIYVYILKLPVVMAIGTSLFTIFVASFSGGIGYILIHRIDYASLIYMAIGTFIGTTIGVNATKKVHPDKIKILFAYIVLFGGCVILIKQLGLDTLSKFLIFSIALFAGLGIIFYAYFYSKSTPKTTK